MFEPLFSALIGGWEMLLIGLSLLVFLLVTGGILVAIFLLIKKDSSKKTTPPIPPLPSPAIPPTEIIRSNCPQCGTPLSSGTLAGLCPVCLLKTGAATETFTDAKQPPFIPPATTELAAKFPQLEILELIGKGGMGAVYKARQKQLDRIVALKILPPGIGDDPAFAERFTREAKALAKLNHPGIVTLYEFGQTQNLDASSPVPNASRLFYFLMEFVDGVNLRQLLQNRPVSAREALAIVPQICDALQFAHDQGIVHRDIKPENILLDRRGRVKVADFGLAKIVAAVCDRRDSNEEELQRSQTAATANLTDAGKIMGTPNYMSPEQKENPGEVDHRADIYALGVVFYQMLTGELPGKRLEPPSKKVQIDVRLDEIVLRALEKKPELRYQQASALKTQIETMAGGDLKPEVRSQEPEEKPRFSRTAIVGAVWVLPIILCFILNNINIRTTFLELLSLPALFITTVLGWIAVSQIRRSGGKIYGMGLAVLDGLLFPLLALDGFIAGSALFTVITLTRRDSSNPHSMIHAWTDFWWIPMIALMLIVILDVLVIRLVWQTVNKPLLSSVPPPIQKPDRFWRWLVATTVIVMMILSVLTLALVLPRALSKRAHTNIGYIYDQPSTASSRYINTVHELSGAPFIAELPGGGKVELLAVQVFPSTNEIWWQLDGSPSPYGADVTIEDPKNIPNGVLALARLPVTLATGATNHNYSFPHGLHFALKDGQRMDLDECGVLVFEQPIANTQTATTLNLPFGMGDWQTLTTKKQRFFGHWFASAADKQWTFSETAVGVLKVTVDHLIDRPDAEYAFVAVDNDGMEHKPSMIHTSHTSGDIYSKYEMTFDTIDLAAPLMFKNFRELRLESRPYQQIQFRNVSLQPSHHTKIEVSDFSAAFATDNATQLAQAGWELWQAHKLNEAAIKFEQALQLDPNDANAWNGLGWATFNAGKTAEAETAFRKVLFLQPGHPAAANGLGQIYLSQGKFDEAELYLSQAAKQAPAAWFGLARLYLLQGKYAAAQTWAQKIVDSGQGDETAEQMLEAAKSEKLSASLRATLEPQVITKNLSFGPVIERVLVDSKSNFENESERTNALIMIDFDSDTLRSGSSAMWAADSPAQKIWMQTNGIDALAVLPKINGLVGLDLKTVMVGTDAWTDYSAEKVSQMMLFPLDRKVTDQLPMPCSFLFETREGGIGILQVVSFTDHPHGVKIRYKMVKQDAKQIIFTLRWLAQTNDSGAGEIPFTNLDGAKFQVAKTSLLEPHMIDSIAWTEWRGENKKLFLTLKNPADALLLEKATSEKLGNALAIIWRGKMIGLLPVTQPLGNSVEIPLVISDNDASALEHDLNSAKNN